MQCELAMNTQGLLIDISTYICILKLSSNVVAQLTKMCRPVGCRPVRLSPSRLSPSGFVAQMTVHLILPAIQNHRPWAGTKLYCLVTYTCVNDLPQRLAVKPAAC